jgi:hypothetical protein
VAGLSPIPGIAGGVCDAKAGGFDAKMGIKKSARNIRTVESCKVQLQCLPPKMKEPQH